MNSISSLIATDPVQAEQIVGCLAVLLRTSLDTSNRPLISLREELAIVQSYVDIERARFGDKLRGSVDVPAEALEMKVPPMSVQTLAENAVKHGITPKAGGGEISMVACAESGTLRIEVRDSGPGFDLSVVPPGHGPANLVERLNALFGDKARLNAFHRDCHSVVEMVLPRMKLRAYLVDDEPLALERLRRLLQQTGKVEVIGSTTEPEQAVAALTADPPDVCFLDIQMPRLNGFDVLGKPPRQPIVIFTTAYDQYALKAFGVNSVDYLLKPIEPEAVERAIKKVETLRESGPAAQPDFQALLKQITDSVREVTAEYPERIASRLGDRIWFLNLNDVTDFFAEDKLTYAVSDGKAYCVDHAIADISKRNWIPRSSSASIAVQS